MDVYQEHGYKNREHYLLSLAEDFDVDVGTVQIIADSFGPNEDFDGLVNALEDEFGY